MTGASAVAFPRIVRAVPLRTLVVFGLAAAAPTVLTVVTSGTDVRLALVAAAVVGGAAMAHAVDDDAEVVLAASPTPLAERRASRLVAALLVAGASWTVALVVAGSAGLLHGTRFDDLAVEALAAAGLGVGTASAVRREVDLQHAGLVGAAAGVTGMLLVTMLSMQYPSLPRLGDPQGHGRWVWVALVGWATVCWASRDPAGQARSVRHR